MRARVAFITVGVLKKPVGDEIVQGFVDRIPTVYAESEGSAGFFARSVRDLQTWEHSWGPVIAPRCVPEGLPLSQLALTLSLWQDLESVAAFAYGGLHGAALSMRWEWFERGPWPSHAAWWVPADHQPDWAEGAERLDHLHTNGPQPRAFNFRKPFDAEGNATRLKRSPPVKPG
jgi:hypothetical protein